MKRRIAIISLLLVLTAGVAVACSWPREIVEVGPSVLRESLVARALVEPKDGTSELRARVAGSATSVLARAGDRVAKGALLAELESEDVALELAQARADLRSLAATAVAVEEGARPEERDAVAAEASAARAELELARDRSARHGRLLAADLTTDERSIEADRGLDAACARLDAALARSRLADAGGRACDVEAARARAAAAAARVNELETRLSWTRVVAPRDGIVVARLVNPGDVVAPGAPLFEIADERAELKIEVEQHDALALAVGSTVAVTLPGDDRVLARGRVTRVAGRLERRTIGAEEARVRADALVYPAWVELAHGPGGAELDRAPFPLGARLEAHVERPPRPVSAAVPRDAVFVRDGRAVVHTPLGPWFDEVAVELGDADQENVEVRGVPVGARVLRAH